MTGIQESKELIIALVKLGKLAAKQLGDGVDLSDAVAIAKALADEEFRSCIVEGFSGLQSVPEELKDIDVEEAVQLIGVLYEEIKK